MNVEHRNPASPYLRPDSALRLSNVAATMLTQPSAATDLATVMAIFHAALELTPDDPRILLNLTVALDRIPGAAPLMRDICYRCLSLYRKLNESTPPELLLNLSLALHKCYDTLNAFRFAKEAVAAAEKAELPNYILCHYYSNMADAHLRTGDAKSAIEWCTRVLNLENTAPVVQAKTFMSRMSLYLQLGDWDRASVDLERRFDLYNLSNNWLGHPDLRSTPNLWKKDGELLRGKRVLVYLEQGLGDQIQWSRLVQWMASAFHPSSITVACDDKLQRLIRTLYNVHPSTIPDADPTPVAADYDYLVPVMSLIAERHRHGLHPMGDPARNYLKVPIAVDSRPHDVPRRFRVAIYWQGSPQNSIDWQRSCKLEHFFHLASRLQDSGLNIEWHAFQPYSKGSPDSPFAGWDLDAIPLVDHWSDALDSSDMTWTASRLQTMDLFLGVESGQTHLVLAATTVPAIVVHTNALDFRWHHSAQLYGNENMNVFHRRQAIPGDWAGLFSSLDDIVRSLHGRWTSRQPTTLAGAINPLPVNPAAPEPSLMATGAGTSDTLTL